VLRGDADNVAPFVKCVPTVKAQLDNKSMRDVVYPGARHSFDQFTAKDAAGSHGYDEAATKSAWREMETFLKQ
jgi:dienelactone hydrolase